MMGYYAFLTKFLKGKTELHLCLSSLVHGTKFMMSDIDKRSYFVKVLAPALLGITMARMESVQ